MKYIVGVLLALAVALTPAASAHAESILLNGQKHYYTVQLRSDKRAIVYARIIFENSSTDKDLATYEFSLPQGVSAENVSIQQILAKSTDKGDCKAYETLQQWRTRLNRGWSSSADGIAYEQSKQCLEYSPSTTHDENFDYNANISTSNDYYSYGYYQRQDTSFNYADLKDAYSNNTHTITLAEPVKPKKQGSLLISFTTNNFVSGGPLGRYTYNVRTLLAKQMIDKATVAVNFDTDMYTREAKQKRDYEPTSIQDSTTSNSVETGTNLSSKSTDALVQSIGNGGIYIKSQSSLLPGDTLSVTGVFATNRTVLHSTAILISSGILLAIVAAIILYRVWRTKHPRVKISTETNETAPASGTPAQRLYDRFINDNREMPWGRIFLTSLTSIVGTLAVIVPIGVLLGGFTVRDSSSIASNVMFPIILIITILFGSVVIPMLAMLRFGAKAAYQWSLVHVTIILTLLVIVGSLIATAESIDARVSSNDSCPVSPTINVGTC